MEFAYAKNKTQRTGTAFVVRGKAGHRYVVTAAHLYRDDEWATLRTVTLLTMEGQEVGQCEGPPLYVGKFTEDSPHSKAPLRNYAEDLMIIQLPENSTAEALPLSDSEPKSDEPVWAVGCEAGKPGSQKLYACRVHGVSDTSFGYVPLQPFNPWDFSGGPVVNQKGQVVGNLLAGSRSRLTGTTVRVIRQRFKELRIEIE